MNRVPTDREIVIIHLLRKRSPITRVQFEGLGLKLKEIGDGLYRTAYRIEDTELVVKLCKDDGVDHAQREIEVWKHLLRSPMAKVVPPLRYYNHTCGLIVTDLITIQANTDLHTRHAIDNWKYALEFPRGFYVSDTHPQNVGVYQNRFVFNDLGLFCLPR